MKLSRSKIAYGESLIELMLKTDNSAQSGRVLFNLESTWKQLNIHGALLDHVTSVRYPVTRKLITINKAPFINVTSKEQFEKLTHRTSINVFADTDSAHIKHTSIGSFKPDSFTINMKYKSITNMTRSDWKLGWNELV